MKPSKVQLEIELTSHLLHEAMQLENDQRYAKSVLGDDYCDVDHELEAR